LIRPIEKKISISNMPIESTEWVLMWINKIYWN
jgi:hypothetical protein